MANTPALSQSLQGEAALSRVDRDWLTVLGCGICLMLSVGSLLIYVFGVFVRPLAIQFHWTRTQVASALVIGQFVVAFSSPVWGFLVDRFGPRRVTCGIYTYFTAYSRCWAAAHHPSATRPCWCAALSATLAWRSAFR